MKTLFEIGPITSNEPSILFLEIGETYLSASIVDNKEKTIKAIRVYTFNLIGIEESVLETCNSLKGGASNFEKVFISAAFPEALLVPAKLFQNHDLIKTAYQLNDSICLQDHIAEWQIINSYAIASSLHNQLQQTFPDAVFMHVYTPLLKIFNGFASEQQVAVYFVHNQFRVIVKKNQQVQLVQTYTYTSPMDVVYYLLKICLEFNLEQEDTQVIISGFIEQNSALYKQLHNYFLNLHFANNSFLRLPESEHPKHYFTSINTLASCVL